MKVLTLEPLTRVEGHGRVDLILQHGELHDVRVSLNEPLRLFEGLLLGRSFAEVPALVCRICSICTAVHRVASARALEQALGVTVPPAAEVVRELLVLGGHLASHALHLFCLVLPDLAGTPDILTLARDGHPLAVAGLELKRLGNRIQEVAGGRIIHPINVEVGGILYRPSPQATAELAGSLARWQETLPGLLDSFLDPGSYPSAAPAVGTRLAVAGDGKLVLGGDFLSLSDGRRIPVSDYRELLGERVVSHSQAKQSGSRQQVWLTGALARHELAGRDSVRLPPGIYGNNGAQARELSLTLARCSSLLEELGRFPGDAPLLVPVKPDGGMGTAAMEAPRGLLIHHYVLDEFGRVAIADIVTPTAVNQVAMELQLLEDLRGVIDEEELRRRAAWIIRAFDPCISCAVHIIKGPGDPVCSGRILKGRSSAD